LSFQLPFLKEKTWTKCDVFEKLKAGHLKNVDQRKAGCMIIRKTNMSVEFVKMWYETCCNYKLLDDSPSICPNDPSFKENRHDQSIFSILCGKYNIKYIKNETANCQDTEKPILV